MLDRIYTLLNRIESLNSLKRPQHFPIENLVLEGGGVKGIAYAKALEVLQQKGLLSGIKRVAGSSAGGIITMLLAVGYEPLEIERIMSQEINFKDLMDSRESVDPTRFFKAAGMPIGVSDIYRLFQNKGLYKGDKFLELAKNLLNRKIEEKLKNHIKQNNKKEFEGKTNEEMMNLVETKYRAMLEKYYITDPSLITFEQLNQLNQDYPDLGFKELFVTGTRVKDSKLTVFSAQTNPKMPIVLATRITMSFPFGFEPVMFNGELYIDGGVADNYPMSIFDRPHFLSHGRNDANVNPCTLGLLVDSRSEINERWGVKEEELKNGLALSSLIEGVLRGLQVRSEVLKQFYSTNSIQIFDENIETMDFNLDEQKIAKLLLSGKNAMEEYIENYRSEGVVSHQLPDHQSFKEKVYSASSHELIYQIENRYIPLMKELSALISVLGEINIPQEISELNKEAQTNNFLKQEKIYEEIEELATYCEFLNNQLGLLEKSKLFIENQKKIYLERINLWEKERKEPSAILELYESLREMDAEFYINQHKQNNVKESLALNQKKIETLTLQIDKPLFERINKRKMLLNLQKDNTLLLLQKADEMLNEQLDEIVSVLQAQGINYPDPRVQTQFEIEIFKIREAKKKENMQFHQSKFLSTEEEARVYAQKYDEIFEDILSFGFSLEKAQDYAQYYLSLNAFFKEEKENTRLNFFKDLFIDRLIEQNIIQLSDENAINWLKTTWEETLNDLSHTKGIKRGYAEYLAKEQTIKKWNERQAKKKVVPTSSQYETIKKWQESVNRLSEGKWAGRFKVKERTYFINTDVFEATELQTYLSVEKSYEMPPIKMHLLRPETLTSGEKPEIVIVFEQPGEAEKDSQFALLSKFSKHREAEFLVHKKAILQRIRFAILQLQEKGLNKNEKINLTIIGEGLAGQDAQYLLSELVEELNQNNENDVLQAIQVIHLNLIDSSRVAKERAHTFKKEVQKLKEKRPEFTLSGYALIQQKSYLGITKKRKPRNYIGERHIISDLEPHEMTVTTEFRDLYAGNILYKKLTNDEPEKLTSALNKQNALYSGRLYRKISLQFKQLKVFSQGLFGDFLPQVTNLLLNLPLQTGKEVIRRTTNPLYRLYRVFKQPKPSIDFTVNWLTLPKTHLDHKDERVSWEDKAKQSLKRFNPENRLRETDKIPIENLVLAGGMGRGIAYGGALVEMQSKGILDNVKRLAGSSEGGLVAALLAIGYEPEELIKLLGKEFNSKALEDESFSLAGLDKLLKIQGVDVSLGGILSSLATKGLYQGEGLEALLKSLIKNKLEQKIKMLLYDNLTEEEFQRLKRGPNFLNDQDRNAKIEVYLQSKLKAFLDFYLISDLGNITLGQLQKISQDFPDLNLKELSLTGTRVRDASLKIFSSESEPDIPLVKAIRITTSTPGKYVPVLYDNEYYISGNIANDYPVEIFDKSEFLTHGVNESGANPSSIGLMVNEDAYRAKWGGEAPKKKFSLSKLVESVFKGLYSRSSIVAERYQSNTIIIPEKIKKTSPLKRLLFFGKKFTREESQQLVELGKETVSQHAKQYKEEAGLYPSKNYKNLMHKYYSKNPMELKRILETEIIPLKNEIEKLVAEGQDKTPPETFALLEQLNSAFHVLLEEENMIYQALQSKGVTYKITTQQPLLSTRFPIGESAKLLVFLEKKGKTDIASLFKSVFPEPDWNYELNKDTHTYSQQNVSENRVKVDELEDKLSFSGKPVAKIIEAASTYDKLVKSQNLTLEYQIEVEDLGEAYSFLRELATNGFKIEEIKKIKMTKSSETVDPEVLISKIKEQMQLPTPIPATKRPKPFVRPDLKLKDK